MGAPIRKSMEGKTVGIWVVGEIVFKPKGTRGGPRWHCKCKLCGHERTATTSNLERGKNNTCKKCRPSRFVDLTGKKFGRLTVVGRDFSKKDNKGRGIFWSCLCECGTMVAANGSHLSSRHTASCGCIKVLPDDTVFWNRTICEYKTGARGRKIEWSLTDSEAIEIMLRDCFYCGEPPRAHKKFTGGRWSGRTIERSRNGIDRIESSGGYTKENCVTACSFCNVGKSDDTLENFVARAARIYWRHASKRKPDGRNGVGNDHSESSCG